MPSDEQIQASFSPELLNAAAMSATFPKLSGSVVASPATANKLRVHTARAVKSGNLPKVARKADASPSQVTPVIHAGMGAENWEAVTPGVPWCTTNTENNPGARS